MMIIIKIPCIKEMMMIIIIIRNIISNGTNNQQLEILKFYAVF